VLATDDDRTLEAAALPCMPTGRSSVARRLALASLVLVGPELTQGTGMSVPESRWGAVLVVDHSVLVRKRPQKRALAPAAAPVGSIAAPAPITAVALPKAAIAGWLSSIPLAVCLSATSGAPTSCWGSCSWPAR
jgi:hypothetical protein